MRERESKCGGIYACTAAGHATASAMLQDAHASITDAADALYVATRSGRSFSLCSCSLQARERLSRKHALKAVGETGVPTSLALILVGSTTPALYIYI